MRRSILGLFVSLAVCAPIQAWAQTDAPPKVATDLTKTEMDAYLKRALQEGISDQNLRVVEIGPYGVGSAVILRRYASATSKGIGNIGGFLIHPDVTEIYYITRGTGTQITGGTLVKEGEKTRIDGGRTSQLTAGDIQIIPPNVPHGWSSVDPAGIDYLIFRVAPPHSLKEKR
jgi:mannose-6-phosphate isomerase-like protein (cupin superfamily)